MELVGGILGSQKQELIKGSSSTVLLLRHKGTSCYYLKCAR